MIFSLLLAKILLKSSSHSSFGTELCPFYLHNSLSMQQGLCLHCLCAVYTATKSRILKHVCDNFISLFKAIWWILLTLENEHKWFQYAKLSPANCFTSTSPSTTHPTPTWSTPQPLWSINTYISINNAFSFMVSWFYTWSFQNDLSYFKWKKISLTL